MRNSKIQWCDDTVNPVMGCDGCELWPSRSRVIAEIIRILAQHTGRDEDHLGDEVRAVAEQFVDEPMKGLIVGAVQQVARRHEAMFPKSVVKRVVAEAKGNLKCYAGVLTENRAGKLKGYPRSFDEPMPFPGRLVPGRMALAAAGSDLRGVDRPEKPWLNGLPRLVFISDMGDALSASIPFEYLRDEIVDVAESEKGPRHRWLWLTKRPARMAEFSRWLRDRKKDWPATLMAMTSVTSQATVGRVDQIRQVECGTRGLSVEPLWTPARLPLEGIDWVILGGESGAGAKPFHLEWARDVREQCRRAGVAFFMKQLGRRPVLSGDTLELEDKHGGDWDEWPGELRVREMPAALMPSLPRATSNPESVEALTGSADAQYRRRADAAKETSQ